MKLKLKLAYNDKKQNSSIEDAYAQLLILSANKYLPMKLSTKRLLMEKDRKDERNIRSLKKVELTYEQPEGFYIFKGHLSCSFRHPFGGEFFLLDVKYIENGNYKDLSGVSVEIKFDNKQPTEIEEMFDFFNSVISDQSFIFNFKQFDEFMEVFNFYKTISDEINNTATFEIISSTKPYYFISVDVKDIYEENGNIKSIYEHIIPVYDGEHILKGYRVPKYLFERFGNELKDSTLRVCDLTIKNEMNALRKIKKMSNNLFVSNMYKVSEKQVNKLHEVEFMNMRKEKDLLIISVIEDNEIDEKYLNLYDMGQKIKIESIEESLKLISQGDTGAAMPKIKYLIGDEPMPSNSKKINNELDYISKALNKKKMIYTKNLNESQTLAFLKAIDGSPVTLIKGPPGTGKTHVINAITQYITKELKEKVVISSQTHVAIDNVLDKLMENKDLIIPNRITNRKNKYSIENIDRTLYNTWGKKLINRLEDISPKRVSKKIIADLSNFKGEELIRYSDNMLDEFLVIGATTTTSAIAGKKGIQLLKDYQWLIIDEVSKSPITEVLRYLPYVEKIILVGDDYQLSPLLEFTKEDVKDLPSYDEDKFEKLQTIYEQSVFSKTIQKAEEAGRLVLLKENYRSVKDVLNAYNIFYDYSLINQRDQINPETIEFKDHAVLSNDKNVFFVEPLGGVEVDDKRTHSRYNIQEAKATAIILEDILNTVKKPGTVTAAAIFPYAAQISYFTRTYKDLINRAKKTLKTFELDTVDAFQGRETDIVLVNTVVTRLDKRNFLSDFKRINVAMSRAKDKLVIFGSRNLRKLEMNTPDGGKKRYFNEILNEVRIHGKEIQINNEGEIIYNERTNKFKIA